MSSEISQKKIDTIWFLLMWYGFFFLKKENFIIIEKKIVASGGRRGREQMGKGNIKKFKNG